MADNLTVYGPVVIPDNPLPTQADAFSTAPTQQISSQGVVTPAQVPDQPLGVKIQAQEVLSQTLNTKTKKILQEYQFTPSGALQIGQFTPGVNGDVRISPDGIVARDQSGNTTFALDGDSGDATFAGEIKSGSVVTGEVIVGNNRIIIDGENERIIINDGTDDRILIGFDAGGF